MPSGVTAVALATAAAQNKIFGFGTTTLIISNEEMNVMMKVIKSL